MARDLSPPLPDAKLSADVVEARLIAEAAFAEAREVEPLIASHLSSYREILELLSGYLTIPLDTSTLDLSADTRWTALWQLSARSIALTHGLLAQVEQGLGVEAYPTARTIHEANRLIQVFCDPDEDDLLREWLNDRALKASVIRRAMARIEKRRNANRTAAGEPSGPSQIALHEALYTALSESAHLRRSSTELGVSITRRTIVTGPNPDWGVRAYFTGWAGAVTYEVADTVLRAFATAGGSWFWTDVAKPLLVQLEQIAVDHPLPETHMRRSAVEVEDPPEADSQVTTPPAGSP